MDPEGQHAAPPPPTLGPDIVEAAAIFGENRGTTNPLMQEAAYSPTLPRATTPGGSNESKLEALTRVRNLSPLPINIERRVRAAAIRMRRGTGLVIKTPPLAETIASSYDAEAVAITQTLQKVYGKYGPPISAETTGEIIRNLHSLAQPQTDPVEIRSLAQVAGQTRDLMWVASLQHLTPAEAQQILTYEKAYQKQIGGVVIRMPDAASQQRYLAAKQKVEAMAAGQQSTQVEQQPIPVNGWQELMPHLVEGSNDFEEFKAFAKTYAKEIHGLGGKALSNFIYDNFCGRRLEGKEYDPNAPETITALNAIKGSESWIKQLGTIYPEISAGIDPGTIWFFAMNKSKGSIGQALRQTPGDLGRFYLNVKPEMVPLIFNQIAAHLNKSGHQFDAKMVAPSDVDTEYLQRSDKMLLYFGKAEQAAALQLVQDLATQYPAAFEQVKPRFTTGVKDSQGRVLPGIGYGQEPRGSYSFSRTRANILWDVVEEARNQNMTVDDPRFNYAESLARISKKYGVDAGHPAFNA